MTELEIFTKLDKIKLEKLMRHLEMADVMDFMNLHGFKRQSEYYYFKENIDLRCIHRYAVNHFGKMIYNNENVNVRLKPSTWEGHTRNEVDKALREKYAKQFFYDWLEYDKSIKKIIFSLYNEMYKVNLCASEKIMCFLKDLEEELKYLERDYLKYEAISWDSKYLMMIQDEIHECYKVKEENLKIDFE